MRAALLQRRAQMVLHRAGGDAKPLTNGAVGQTFDMIEEEDVTGFGRQGVDGAAQPGHGLVPLDHHVGTGAGGGQLLVWRAGLTQALALGSPAMVQRHAVGHHIQQAGRILDRLAIGQAGQPQEGILREIARRLRIPGPPRDGTLNAQSMRIKQLRDLARPSAYGARHRTLQEWVSSSSGGQWVSVTEARNDRCKETSARGAIAQDAGHTGIAASNP
ncbi:protein of unknown function (plasmid) [Azospirillum baldaniorum]|uniref:Uncharacterized protein n=1 Tax=Azospirillum baldaniorum TaxID=1064539 RepID=A0A9P1K009_9PROT|nr:protein of unknown function [Azospirillum baldaniorum]